MSIVRLKGINTVKKRQADGTIRVHRYHRATGHKLVGEPGSPEFFASIADAEKSKLLSVGRTLGDLIRKYQVSAEFTKLADRTRDEYRRMLSKVEAEFGTMPFEAAQHPSAKGEFLEWRDKNAATLREAENTLTVLARLLSWGAARSYLTHQLACQLGADLPG